MYLPDCQITKENKQEEKIYFIKTHLLVFPSKKGFIDLLRIIKSIFSVNLYCYLIHLYYVHTSIAWSNYNTQYIHKTADQACSYFYVFIISWRIFTKTI